MSETLYKLYLELGELLPEDAVTAKEINLRNGLRVQEAEIESLRTQVAKEKERFHQEEYKWTMSNADWAEKWARLSIQLDAYEKDGTTVEDVRELLQRLIGQYNKDLAEAEERGHCDD